MTYHLLSLTTRKARKQHRCIWCGEAVVPGEKYEDERSAYDGSIQHFHWHPECRKDAVDGWEQGDDNEFMAYSAERPKPHPTTP